ncbi:diguanylate cyclase domain-containing protein [Parachitinimonas caeni]|uniref:Diguanylate cyclase n=1 Tax=Parachitinimonas caeni TaxID=3031301 RepID=A0ABT7E046_9NEIS|nr:diguanylate cyclase [Parachitinimonas caeni]MDK2124287.1 diguanylate cyclase [Parachitinimonas caeni]
MSHMLPPASPLESTLAEMAQLAPLPILMVDAESGVVLAQNQLARDSLGLSGDAPALRSLFDNPSVARQFLLIARNNGFIRQFEARLKIGAGQRIWALLAARLTEMADRTALIVSLIDIHERRLAEESLRESDALHQRVLGAANEGYALFDAETGAPLEVNPALCDMLGYSSDELLTLRLSQVLTEDSIAVLQEARAQFGRGHHRFELILRRRNEELLTAEVSVSVVPDQDGHVTSVFALVADITARKRNEERVLYLAFYDTLTALPNRYLFGEHVEQALRQRARNGGKLALMFVDLDDFKLVNDNYGHDAGDELLRVVARRLNGCVRQSDTVARMGGDEFTLLLVGIAGAEDAAFVAQKILDALAEPVMVGNAPLQVTASIGIAICPDHGEDATSLRRHADLAMYQAKLSGKHSYSVFESGLVVRVPA